MCRVISGGRQALLGALVAVCALVSMDVQAQETVADFKAGPPTGVYAFASSTPRALPDLGQARCEWRSGEHRRPSILATGQR